MWLSVFLRHDAAFYGGTCLHHRRRGNASVSGCKQCDLSALVISLCVGVLCVLVHHKGHGASWERIVSTRQPITHIITGKARQYATGYWTKEELSGNVVLKNFNFFDLLTPTVHYALSVSVLRGVSDYLPLTLLALLVCYSTVCQDVSICRHFFRLHSAYTYSRRFIREMTWCGAGR